MLPAGTALQGGKFLIEERLGSGGFGVTYRATHILFRTTVVIKEYFPRALVHRDTRTGILEVTGDTHAFERGLRMFLREGELVYNLQHPNIVRVTDVFQELGTAYLVMEYLPGQDLAAEIRQTGQRGVSDARIQQVMGALVSALAAIHARGICHLDIKPDNLMCLRDGTVKLIDFGAAKQGVKLATHSHFALTPAFAPPELFDGDSYGPESDIYEAGILLHLLVTGTLPPPLMQRLTGQASFQPRTLRSPYGKLIEKATHLDRRQRPSSITAWWGSSSRSAVPMPTAASQEEKTSLTPSAILPPQTSPSPTQVTVVVPRESLGSRIVLYLGAIVSGILSSASFLGFLIIPISYSAGGARNSAGESLEMLGGLYFLDAAFFSATSFLYQGITNRITGKTSPAQIGNPEWAPFKRRFHRFVLWNLRVFAVITAIFAVFAFNVPGVFFMSALLSAGLFVGNHFYARWVWGHLRPH